MRVLFISLVSVVVLFVVLTITRLWGLGQQYPEFEHPFFASGPVIILKVQTEKELEEALQKKADLAFWLDVTTTSDQKLIVFSRDLSNKEMSIEAYRGPKSLAYPLTQLQNMNPEIRDLKEFLGKYSQQRFVLNVADNVENVHKGLTESLKDLSTDKRILIQSNYNVIMNTVKEIEPFWLYGCSQADLMRFLTFESMWILPATPFKGDVFIAPFVLMGRPAFNESTLEEVRRRNKKIVLGPALDKKEFDDAVRLKADGIVVENLADFLEWSRP
ncbi:hypothetical protein [Bdellovibrio sp. HCB337]|uniref:hypothetical protein n=1 Tax=Bdellovibrio sp. HCB337 TaxID=3394358 RepID=UPI0039A6D3A1